MMLAAILKRNAFCLDERLVYIECKHSGSMIFDLEECLLLILIE